MKTNEIMIGDIVDWTDPNHNSATTRGRVVAIDRAKNMVHIKFDTGGEIDVLISEVVLVRAS